MQGTVTKMKLQLQALLKNDGVLDERGKNGISMLLWQLSQSNDWQDLLQCMDRPSTLMRSNQQPSEVCQVSQRLQKFNCTAGSWWRTYLHAALEHASASLFSWLIQQLYSPLFEIIIMKIIWQFCLRFFSISNLSSGDYGMGGLLSKPTFTRGEKTSPTSFWSRSNYT